jgi:hypothetical protein
MIRTIPNITLSCAVDLRKLGWLAGKRAATRSNFPANFQYIDLRGFADSDLERAIAEEREAYDYLMRQNFSQIAIDEVDRKSLLSSTVPMIDFGVGAAVVALSAFGCVPVTSCRGPTLGMRTHSQPAPMIVFYARPPQVSSLLEAVARANCQIINNDAKLEIYADDVRKLHQFAITLRRFLPTSNARNGHG